MSPNVRLAPMASPSPNHVWPVPPPALNARTAPTAPTASPTRPTWTGITLVWNSVRPGCTEMMGQGNVRVVRLSAIRVRAQQQIV